MDRLYETNMELIREFYPYLEWEELSIEKNNVHISSDCRGRTIIGVEKEDYIWWTSSIYDCEFVAQKSLEKFKDINYMTVFHVMGIGNGSYIKALKDKFPQNVVIVYEPDEELFQAYLQTCDISEICSSKIFIVAGKGSVKFYVELLQKLINYDNKSYVKFIDIPNYIKINKHKYVECKKIYLNRMERMIYGRNTGIVAEEYRAQAYLSNLFHYVEGYSFENIIGEFQNKCGDRPAIVVAAGPSLDKNVKYLKKAKGKAFIIAVDTSLKTLHRNGITPDMIVTIDPEKDEHLFDDWYSRNVPMYVSIYANSEIVDKYKGKLFFATYEDSLLTKYAEKYSKKLYLIMTGGSVANNALSIAALLEFKTIILVGQDLAYPNGQIHAKDAYVNEAKMELSSKYFEVEAYGGGKVYTEANMECYKNWIEEEIVLNPCIEVINATEGGARIKGTKEMTLKESIELKCKNLSEINFDDIFEKIDSLFNEKEQIEIREEFMNFENMLDEYMEDIVELSDLYMKVEDKLQGKGECFDSYSDMMCAIGDMGEKIEKNPLILFARMYENAVEFSAQDSMNLQMEKEETEAIKALHAGRMICTTYLRNCNRIKEEWHELLIKNRYIEDK